MKRSLSLAVISLLLVLLSSGVTSSASTRDVLITDQVYVRHDGGTDVTIASCGSDATTPGAGGDGGGNRQANEPSVAINPNHPKVIVAGANDYCTVQTVGDAWMGFYVSKDGGRTWKNSLNPGYPTDTSAEGQASPIFGRAGAAGDPIMDWDNQDRFFYGGISFNRTLTNESGLVTPANGDVIVSTWQLDPATPLGLDYLRTVIVGQGSSGRFPFAGRFNDKPSLVVDKWSGSPNEGSVYVSWTMFPGSGQNQVLFSRSADHGATFSKPIQISMAVPNAQGSDIAVAPDGTVYVVWRQFAFPASGVNDAIIFVKSKDGGQTFTTPRTVAAVPFPYDRSDRYDDGSFARDCGDGVFHCQSNFVFHRTDALPQAAVDRDGVVHVTWEQVTPASPDGTTYRPEGQSQVVVTRSGNGGDDWAAPIFVDLQSAGHQWWPNLAYDKSINTLAVIYYDSREDPFYSPNRPPGNRDDGTSSCGVPAPADCNVLNTFIATSTDGGDTWAPRKVSAEGHQPEYEMFGNRQVPFHGDYLWVDAAGGAIFGVWSDNRNVVPGSDPREGTAQDGFDVLQCRTFNPSTGTFGSDTCPNAGGLNQNIYGAKLP